MLSKFFVTIIIVISFAFSMEARATEKIQLPTPKTDGGISAREAIYQRRSIREYSPQALTLEEVSQILWAAGGKTVDGVTGPTRAYPSAGGVYPLEFYLAARNVEGLEEGLYHYNWEDNSLTLIDKGDFGGALTAAAYGQKMMQNAPATVIITAIYEKTTSRYGEQGRVLYVPMDAGHAGQNIHLEAENLGLGTVMVSGFKTESAEKALKNVKGTPIYMMPIGHPKK